MAVYVDNMEARFGRMVMCHMCADTLPELLAMADLIGIARKWLQTPPKASWVHFDIAKTKRSRALDLGAKEIAWRDIPAYADRQADEPSYAQWKEALVWERDRRVKLNKLMEEDNGHVAVEAPKPMPDASPAPERRDRQADRGFKLPFD